MTKPLEQILREEGLEAMFTEAQRRLTSKEAVREVFMELLNAQNKPLCQTEQPAVALSTATTTVCVGI